MAKIKIVSDGTLYVKPKKDEPAQPVEPGTPVDVDKAEAESLIERGLVRRYSEAKPRATVETGSGGKGKGSGSGGGGGSTPPPAE